MLVEAHELARFLVRQRGEQHCLKHTEHRRGAADSHGERDGHSRGEAGITPYLSNRVPDILLHRAPMLPRGVKQQVSEHLEPEAQQAIGCASSEQQCHLLSVLLAEVARIEAQKPPIDTFGPSHARHPPLERRLVRRAWFSKADMRAISCLAASRPSRVSR